MAPPRQFAGDSVSWSAYEPNRCPVLRGDDIERWTVFASSALIDSSLVLPFGITVSDLTMRYSANSFLTVTLDKVSAGWSRLALSLPHGRESLPTRPFEPGISTIAQLALARSSHPL